MADEILKKLPQVWQNWIIIPYCFALLVSLWGKSLLSFLTELRKHPLISHMVFLFYTTPTGHQFNITVSHPIQHSVLLLPCFIVPKHLWPERPTTTKSFFPLLTGTFASFIHEMTCDRQQFLVHGRCSINICY